MDPRVRVQVQMLQYCPNAYVGQTGRQPCTGVKEHKGTVRRQDKNFRLALHCLMTGIERPSSKKGPPGIHAILSRHKTQHLHVSISA